MFVAHDQLSCENEGDGATLNLTHDWIGGTVTSTVRPAIGFDR